MNNTKEMLATLEEFKGHIQVYFKRQKEVVSKVLKDYNFDTATYYKYSKLPSIIIRLVHKDLTTLFGFTGNHPSEILCGLSHENNYTAYDFLEYLYTVQAVDCESVNYFTDIDKTLSSWESLMIIQGKLKSEGTKEKKVTSYINVEWLDLVIAGNVDEYLTRYETELRASLDAFAPMFLEEIANEPTWETEIKQKEEKEIAKLKKLAERYPQVVKSLAFEA